MSKIKKDQDKRAGKKDEYRIVNWREYNKALINRGDITLYFTAEAEDGWFDKGPAQKGAQFIYSDLCIETLAMLKEVLGLPYRQLQGFVQSLLMLMRLEHLDVPSYTQISRRIRQLDPDLSIPAGTGPLILVIDSTGLKIYGEGEWKVRKHGYSKRRTWRKLHLGSDPDTGFIHCCMMTDNSTDDASQLEPLLDQVAEEVDEACMDGAYDTEDCWHALMERTIIPVIPPRCNAVEWHNEQPEDWPDHPRNVIINQIEKEGRKKWKEQSGYHRRSLAENAMFRIKTIFGPRLYSRKIEPQAVETRIRIKALNIMTAQGMPKSVKVKAV